MKSGERWQGEHYVTSSSSLPFQIRARAVSVNYKKILRLGYDGDDTKPERSQLGLGLCFKQAGKQDYSVEYGYRSWGQLGTIQAVSVGMSF